jgi:hypothetical protein
MIKMNKARINGKEDKIEILLLIELIFSDYSTTMVSLTIL